MNEKQIFQPKGKPLTESELLKLATIIQSDVENMNQKTSKVLQPFINATTV